MSSNTTTSANPLLDWIEITNTGATSQDLGGWKLKDGGAGATATWTFPTPTVLPAGGQLVVWADTILTPPVSGTQLHTSFGLASGGEYLGLLRPDLSIAHEFSPAFPSLIPNTSYGINNVGDERIFSTPTPGAANGPGDLPLAATVVAAPKRGFYTTPTLVTLTTATVGAQIQYTTDGSRPSATNGTTYVAPFTLSTTKTLRTTAILAGLSNAAIATDTYVFVANVLQQGNGIPGFPNGTPSEYGNGTATVPDFTAMDTNVIDAVGLPAATNALTAIPTMSLTAPIDTVFGAGGFYYTDNIEQPVSVELLYPNNPAGNQQIDGGVEGHSHVRLKRSLRVNFRAAYGNSTWTRNLLKTDPNNAASATTKIRTMVLRAGNNRSWARASNPDATDYTLDELYRGSQVAMNGYGSHGTFVHLYLNGVYWGLYDVAERPDDDWAADYLGGSDNNWHFVNHGAASNGDPTRWNYLTSTLVNRDMTIPANYAELQSYLDVSAFADYAALNTWFGMTDWPLNNWYANNRNTAGTDTATPARYYAWDGEWSMDRKKDTLVQGASVHPEFLPGATPASTIGKLWKAAWANPSFQALFHSRVTLHTAPGGALSDAAVTARYDALNNQVRDAVIGESIRWGDALSSIGQPTRTRDVDWQREVTALRALIAGNTARFISALRAEGYYPSTTPPAISPAPGLLTGNVTITNPNATGTILYTTDGSDPTVNPAALTYTTPISLSVSTTVRATVRIGTSFTPVTANTYILSSFSVTEINYNPAPASPAEIAAGFLTGDAFEYIEIRNNSSQPLNLANFAFITGVTTGPLTGTVAPNEVVVLVFNAAGFASRHGATARVVGTYTGTLSNGGEQVVATYPAGINAIDFVYDDIAPWPLTPDGTGPSLVALTTTGLSLPTNWAASGIVGGTPGFIPDTVAPSVVSVSPVDAATVTAAGLIPSVTFSEPVAAFASLALATEAGVPVATTNTIAGNTVSLTPATTLAVGTAFRITVPTTVTDIAGNALATAFTSTFTTATPPPADTTPPTVSAVAPTNAATGVAVGTIPAVTFSEPVTAITGIALAIDGGATVPTTATLTGNIVTLTPASPLAAGTTYRLTVPTTVTDIAGNALATAFTSTFTSVVVVTPPTTDILKVSRSTSRTPAVALTGNNWLPSEQVSVFLDTPQAAISVRFYLDTPTTGTPRRTEGAAPWDFNGGSITTANAFVNNLTAGTHIIRALLTRANGTTQTYESIFTVGTTPPPPDTTRPTISGVNPTNAATSITVSVVPTVTFSEPVTRITVPTTVTDTAGNTLATAFTSTFTTVAAPPVDTTRPTVVSVNPTNAATNIAVGAVPTVTFSEPVTALAGITLAIDGGATVAAASGITGNTVTITPAALLAAGTTYRITAATTVTDIAGNTLAAAFTSTFTTAVVVPPTTDILKVSRSATRSPAVVLAGNTSARGEQLFIFLDTAQAAVSVRFYLDTPVTGVPRRTEGAAPWDFSGGNLTTATPFTNNLTVGTHTVRAVLTRANGTTQTYESTFTVT